jgi:hypothetical protein
MRLTRKLALTLVVGLAVGLPDASADRAAPARPAVAAAPAVWKAGLKNGLASGLAVVCSKSLLQPFDTLKTLQQASSASGGMAAAASKLVSTHGFLALYRGLGISLFGAVPSMCARDLHKARGRVAPCRRPGRAYPFSRECSCLIRSAYFAVYQSSKTLLWHSTLAPPLTQIAHAL